MNIKILDSWLKEHLQTDATPKQIAERLSLTSVGIERVEKWKNDYQYDIEVTTNRPDLASVIGLAREAGAVLPQSGIQAAFLPLHLSKPHITKKESVVIEFDPKLVNRICAVVMEVEVKQSPDKIKDRLEASEIRSLNNIIDVTNYVMRTIGHPTHVFDFDKLPAKKLIIRESKKGEKITTLDKKSYTLPGGDIVADDSKGGIVDLLAIMGLEESVVSNDTKRILFFVNNNEVTRIRKTSMTLGIRTEAAQLNEKGVDPELAMDALLYGIQLYQQIAGGKVISDIIDLYPKKPVLPTVSVSLPSVSKVIGVEIPTSTAVTILKDLGFRVEIQAETLHVTVPSSRAGDISIPEDIIEEIARVFGYHKIPSIIPQIQPSDVIPEEAEAFYWETRVKQALKYWGFTEVYSYPMVSRNTYEGNSEDSVKLANPLGEEYVYMRSSLAPSLIKVASENKGYSSLKIFEIANIYQARKRDLPLQIQHFAGLLKGEYSFFHAKGILEQLFADLGITQAHFSALVGDEFIVNVSIGKERIGSIMLPDKGLIHFELDFSLLLTHASVKKTFKPITKYPSVIEDISLVVPNDITTGEIITFVKKQSSLIKEITLMDKYQDTRTFHILYQDPKKNLTNEEVGKIREKVLSSLKTTYSIRSK